VRGISKRYSAGMGLAVALAAILAIVGNCVAEGQAADGHYQLVEGWAKFPPGMTKWSAVTGVDVDAHDNVYVFQRDESMPILVFDKRGKFLRTWGKGLFKQAHFLRVYGGHVWVTDRVTLQAYEFDLNGKLLMTLGKRGVPGDNTSKDAFNGVADVAVGKNGDVFVADGEGPNTRVVKFSKNGRFLKWWGGKGKGPGEFDTPHSIAMDAKGRVYVADRANNRIQIFDESGKFLDQWTNFGTPWGLFVKGDLIYVVDGTANNCLLIANIKDGKIVDRMDRLNNATAVAVDSSGALYIGEVNGMNVKKFVKK
jgi:DNA-binding beta-propeller fold protein YncE